MKKFATALVLALSVSAFAGNRSDIEDLNQALTEISTALNSRAEIEMARATRVLVTFTVNEDQEVSVLKVDSNDSMDREFVKSSLQNFKLRQGNLVVGKTYQFYLNVKK